MNPIFKIFVNEMELLCIFLSCYDRAWYNRAPARLIRACMSTCENMCGTNLCHTYVSDFKRHVTRNVDLLMWNVCARAGTFEQRAGRNKTDPYARRETNHYRNTTVSSLVKA